VSATASQTERGMAITVINRHFREDAEVCVDTRVPGLTSVRARVLTAPAPNAVNSADAPDCVSPVDLAAVSDGGGVWRLDLPRHSLATLVLTP
jgi:alpha-L-arabinofuranosidase